MFNLESFLCKGLIFDIFNRSGKIPVLNDLLHISAIGLEINGAISLIILGGRLFGPTPFEVSKSFIIDSISLG
mgnify:CR=1 FL=1